MDAYKDFFMLGITVLHMLDDYVFWCHLFDSQLGSEVMGEGDHLEDPGLDWWISLKLIFKKWDGGMDWIDVAQDRDRW